MLPILCFSVLVDAGTSWPSDRKERSDREGVSLNEKRTRAVCEGDLRRRGLASVARPGKER